MTQIPAKKPEQILLHFRGPDRPGVTSRIAGIISEEKAKLIDLGQSVLNGYLILSAIIEIPPQSDALKKILFSSSDLGMLLEVKAFQNIEGFHSVRPIHHSSLFVTLLGDLSDGVALAKTAEHFATRQMNIRELRSLATRTALEGMELIVDLPETRQFSDEDLRFLRGEILDIAQKTKVDMAVQKNDLFNRSRRLICMDVDSTFVQMEVIDELGRLAGCMDKVSKITERAMQGELDFNAALKERVALLKGLPYEKAQGLLQNIPLMPGAERFVKILKALGYKVGLVSGGFTFFVNHLKDRFGFDFAFANDLEVIEGKLTGKVKGTIVNAERKAQVLKDMTHAYGFRLEQTIAVGDGANDRFMLEAAGLGIAFHAKPRLQEVASLSLNKSALDSILFLMGYSETDLALLLDSK